MTGSWAAHRAAATFVLLIWFQMAALGADYHSRLEEVYVRIARRAEGAEQVEALYKLERAAQSGNRNASAELQTRLEVLADSGSFRDDPLFTRYYFDLRRRLFGDDRSPAEVGAYPSFSANSAISGSNIVERFRRYFAGPGHGWMNVGVRRMARYRTMIEQVLAEEGLPQELLYVPMVESLYDPTAVSPAGAKGLWQFIPETARRNGLVVNERIDEREDPVKSTRAAARYLKDLYRQFGDWALVLAAYNSGENRVERLLRRNGARTFWTLARRNLLPKETRNYVPAVLAVVSLLRPANVSTNLVTIQRREKS